MTVAESSLAKMIGTQKSSLMKDFKKCKISDPTATPILGGLKKAPNILFFLIGKSNCIKKKSIHDAYKEQKTKRRGHTKTTAPYGAPNQSTKSSINKELSPIYNLTQLQN